MPRNSGGADVTKGGNNPRPWKVTVPDRDRAISRHGTQAEAEKAAKDYLRDHGGGEARIHRPDGTIRDSDTVAPARDPNPPRDRKH